MYLQQKYEQEREKKMKKKKAQKKTKGTASQKSVTVVEDGDNFKESNKAPVTAIAKSKTEAKANKVKGVGKITGKTVETQTQDNAVSLVPVDDSIAEDKLVASSGKDEFGYRIGSTRNLFIEELKMGPKSMKEIIDVLGCKTMYNFYRDLNAKGLVVRLPDGKMKLTTNDVME